MLEETKETRINKFIYWTPRVLSILLLIFLSLFSLDVFDLQLGFWQTIGALLIHNIPVFILLALLIVAWKHEIVGAVTFFLAGLLYIFLLLMSDFKWYKISWALIISGPAFFIAVLFFINWKRKKYC